MADERDADKPRDTGAPTADTAPPIVERRHTTDVDAVGDVGIQSGHRSESDEAAAVAAGRAGHPASDAGSAERGATDKGNLYDRLAAKDQEPVGPGGDGPVP